MHGLVIGKFMPPNQGHQHLFDFAQTWSSTLTIVVERIAGEPIDSAVRAAWVAQMAPRARVLHLDRHMPQDPSETPEFWSIWRHTLSELVDTVDRPVDLVFASEAYGVRLAKELGARFIPVDPQRHAVPISATQVRADPAAVWPMLPAPVRAHYTRRIAVVGPESSGKSTLSRQLADALGGLWVPEYARTLLEQNADPAADWPDTLRHIARGQHAQEAALARQSPGLLVCDTDLLTTRIWWERLVGGPPPAFLAEQAEAATYDLTVLCTPDLAWEADPVRYLPEEQAWFFRRFEAELKRLERRVLVVSGTDRLAPVLAAWEH